MPACPRCGAPLEALTGCAACGAVLDVDAHETPFALLCLPLAHALDAKALRQRHLRASRVVHPDFFGAAAAALHERAERNTALLNGALEVLSDDVRRADWLVTHLGGPDEVSERAMPQAFLFEVLEWNELLDEARANAGFDARLEVLEKDLLLRRAAALNEISRLLTPLPARGASVLREVRSQINAVRYVDRAREDIEAQRLAKSAS